MKPIIHATDLTKTYQTKNGPVQAVDGASFRIEQGELFGLFGSNGAGKSTLVRILATLIEPTSGRAFVNGHDVLREEMRVRASIGLVAADERSFYGRLSTRQNLEFYAALQNVPRRQIGQRVVDVLGLFGLQSKIDQPFQSLSTGQMQRLNMARALLHDPPILMLDEPTKSMDVQTSDFVKNLIKEELVARRGKTVIFISHELYEMDNFCDRVLILAGGKVRAIGTPDELSTAIPRRAIFRLEITGDPDSISSGWRQIEHVEQLREVSRGVSLTAFDLTLSDETSNAWVEILETVHRCGGRVETYRRVDDGSLREVIKFFTGESA